MSYAANVFLRVSLCFIALLSIAPAFASNTFAVAPDTGLATQAASFHVPPGGALAASVFLEQDDSLKSRIQFVKKQNSEAELKRLEIGVGRDVPQAREARSAALNWVRAANGRVAHWEVSSAGARALRIGLEAAALPAGVEIRFAGEDDADTVYGPFTAADIFAMGPTFWSPVLEGENALVEVFVPDGSATSEVVLSIARVSHLFASPRDAEVATLAKTSQPCEVDLICRSATDAALANIGKSVARMTFTTSSGGTALCTGTLLNPRGGTLVPYFYSANHCISTQSVASTLTTHWFYDRTACGSGGTSPSYVQLAGGATLLYANATSDVLFMRLNSTPPAGAVYAGWDETTLTSGTPITAVHHPAGDLKKVSLGSIGGFSAYGGGTGSTHIIALWNSTATGVTEGGSSGSGIFTAVGQPVTEYRLRGGLHGGPSSCTATGTALRDYYSRFDQAYPLIAQYLNPTTSCSYSLSPTSHSVAAVPGTGSFNLTTSSGCSWTATSNASWITTSSSGSGNGTILYSVAANTSTSSRTGTLTVAGQTFTVTQAAAAAGTSSNLLLNGDFESGGTAWTSSTLSPSSIITNSTAARAGSWYAWLGGYSRASDRLHQDVAIPADSQTAVLQFWYQITTEEVSSTTAYDSATVRIASPATGATLATLATFSNLDRTSGWVQSAQYDVSAFKGQTVRVVFSATTDGSLNTNFRFDDVTLNVMSAATTHALSVSKAGSGTGTVTSSPAGISCGTTCSASFTSGTSVTLTATPAPGSTFTGWSGGGCTGTSTCQVAISSATSVTATFAGSTSLDANVRSVVTSYYETILGRSPDQAGLDFWAGEASRVVGLGADVREVFFALAITFFGSPEYLGRGTSDSQYLTDLYRTFFVREPDGPGLAFWQGELTNVQSRSALLISFLFSTEFSNKMTAIFGTSSVRPEVNMTIDLYRGALGRLPDSAGFNFWLGEIRKAQCQGAAQVSTAVNTLAGLFFNSQEYGARDRNTRDFVGDVYNAYLRRGPGGDSLGFNYWVGQIPALARDGIRTQFVSSPEFQSRVAAVVAAGCIQP